LSKTPISRWQQRLVRDDFLAVAKAGGAGPKSVPPAGRAAVAARAPGSTPSIRQQSRGRVKDDLQELRQRTERFCLQALLFAERPRDFTRYELPLLTTLYRTRRSKVIAGSNLRVVPMTARLVARAMAERVRRPRSFSLGLVQVACPVGRNVGRTSLRCNGAAELSVGPSWTEHQEPGRVNWTTLDARSRDLSRLTTTTAPWRHRGREYSGG
jgi:hypothetical protein